MCLSFCPPWLLLLEFLWLVLRATTFHPQPPCSAFHVQDLSTHSGGWMCSYLTGV